MSLTSCAHCGQPAPERQDAQGQAQPSFCCTGCEAVYHMLHTEGLSSFYRYQQAESCPLEGSPVPQDRLERLEPSQLDLLRRQAVPDAQGVAKMAFYLRGLHCAGCIWLIEQLPQAMPGVLEARVEFGRQRLWLRWRPQQVDLAQILTWLARFGYSAHALRGHGESGQEEAEARAHQRPLLRRLGVAWAVAGNVMLLSIAHYSGLDAAQDAAFFHSARVISLALTSVSLVYGADVFLRRAASSAWMAWRLRGQQPVRMSMDVPLSIGILLGWAYSAWATLAGQGQVWFDSIAMLVAALLTSRWLQAQANARAAEATRQIYSLLPRTARKVLPSGQLQLIESESLQVGDRVRVLAGELMPADGIIIEGHTSLHRGALTGESRPEPAQAGQRVEAGVTNMDNPIDLEVSACGQQTQLGQLQLWIEDHAQRRAPIEQMTDRLGAIFVLGILVMAALTGALWMSLDPQHALERVIAVLVVSCPCALAMATPLALSVALGRAARQHIFIKHDDVVEAIDKAQVVVFDKTGTLTLGELSVTWREGDPQVIEAAARLERQSAHPIGRAIARLSEEAQNVREDAHGAQDALSQIEHVAGRGVMGLWRERALCVGSPSWIAQQLDADELPRHAQALARCVDQGLTPVMISLQGRLAATLGLGDQERPEALQILRALRARGLEVRLLSGDHAQIVRQMGQRLGFEAEQMHGEVTHAQKLSMIQELKGQGRTVVMVGDGVNDAAALQAADVGITFERGAQVSLMASDVFLRGQDLRALLALWTGSGQSMRVIRLNLWTSALYNILAVGLAMIGWISPLSAAILMPLSSLSVVLSSIFQRHFEPVAHDVHHNSGVRATWKEVHP